MQWSKRNQVIRILTYSCLFVFVTVMARHYFMIRASLEESVVELNIRNIRVIWPFFQNIEKSKINHHVTNSLNIQTFLSEAGISPLKNISKKSDLAPGEWGYNNALQSLYYRVQNTQFFRSNNGSSYISLIFKEKDRTSVLLVSSYQWCQVKSWWGCSKW